MGAFYLGVGAEQLYAGAIEADGRITTGRFSEELTVGRLDGDVIYVGVPAPQEQRIGRVEPDGEIYGGVGGDEHLVGRVDGGGGVFAGTGAEEIHIGSAEPPHQVGSGAALLLIAAHRDGAKHEPTVFEALARGLLVAAISAVVNRTLRG